MARNVCAPNSALSFLERKRQRRLEVRLGGIWMPGVVLPRAVAAPPGGHRPSFSAEGGSALGAIDQLQGKHLVGAHRRDATIVGQLLNHWPQAVNVGVEDEPVRATRAERPHA